MKRHNRPRRRKTAILLFSLLALLCIGAAELTACYFFAPTLYQRITGPVRRGVQAVVQTAQTAAEYSSYYGNLAVSEASALWDRLTVPKEKPKESESQLASPPAIASDTPVISDPSITELKAADGQETLTGGVIPVTYFNQGDEAWASQPYGSDSIGGYGCGPTAMSMAVASMTDQESDPAQMAQWAAKHGYWARGNGSYLSIVQGCAKEFGLVAEPIAAYTTDAVQEALLSGNLLVALMGPGHFTNGGHFILLRGVTLSGSVLVADPNSEERSLMEWDPQLILDELSASTANGAPLWVLSVDVSNF